jgi:glycosyltransferase involved in cell wall biosynthesis
LIDPVLLIRHFSTDDIEGGAARAAFRLHTALRESGLRSQMIVRRKKSDDDDVLQLPPVSHSLWRRELNRLKRRIPGLKSREIKADYTFNFHRPPEVDLQPILRIAPSRDEIICLHWINGLLDAPSIRRIHDHFRSPLVWLIHDLEPFTGGCHYSFGCDGYTKQCGACPRIGSTDSDDLSHQIWLRKREHMSNLPICFIAMSSWGEKRARESSLFHHARIERIPLPMDTRVFRPFSPLTARDVMRLPRDKKIILFGATYLEDRRKGIDYLIAAFDILASLIDSRVHGETLQRDDVFLLAMGLNGKGLMERLPFAGRYIGHVGDELMMALAYQSADIFVSPSLDDSAPMMISEAMLCGTPVTAFDGTGASDLVKTMETGYLAANGDSRELARGIHALLTTDSIQSVRDAARKVAAEKHTPSSVASRHAELYKSLFSNSG